MRKTNTWNLADEARKYFRKAQDEYIFTFGKKTLFDMCRQSAPKDVEATASKLWLIGRSHAAALERRQAETENGYVADYQIVARAIVKDSRLAALVHSLGHTMSAERLYDREHLADIQKASERLAAIFKQHTGEWKISLASKYLHFHAPVVPIYDAISVNALTRLVRKSEIPKAASACWKNTGYGRHLARFAAAYAILRSEGYEVDAKTMDVFLLYWWFKP